jgi:hypothetical protein
MEQAAQADMTLGYCDEYWWPSGQAFDRVLKAILNWRQHLYNGAGWR